MLANALQEQRILPPAAVGHLRQASIELRAIHERQAQKLRLDAQRDDHEEAGVREDASGAWQSTECNATYSESMSTTTNATGTASCSVRRGHDVRMCQRTSCGV